MGKKKSTDILANTEIVFALREAGKSFKLYKAEGAEFILVVKFYLAGLNFKKELLKFSTFYEAEDFILRNTKRIVGINYSQSSIL